MTAKGTVSRGDLAVMLYRALTGNFQRTSLERPEHLFPSVATRGTSWRRGTRSGLLVIRRTRNLSWYPAIRKSLR